MLVAAKAFLAALIAGGGAFLATLSNHGRVTLVGGLSAALVGLTALSGVYAIPNKPPPPPSPPPSPLVPPTVVEVPHAAAA